VFFSFRYFIEYGFLSEFLSYGRVGFTKHYFSFFYIRFVVFVFFYSTLADEFEESFHNFCNGYYKMCDKAQKILDTVKEIEKRGRYSRTVF